MAYERRTRAVGGLGPRINMTRAISGPFAANNAADPIPPQFSGVFRYTQYGILTSGTVGVMGTEQVFRLNSCHDPDFTGTGHQPYGWDQIAPLYRQYLVKKCKFKITAYDPSADGVVFGAIIQPANGTLALMGRGAEEVAEKPMCVVLEVANTGSQRVSRTQDVDLPSLNGITKAQYEAQISLYGAAIGANPTYSSYLRIAAGDVRATGGLTIAFRVDLEYQVNLFERVVQGQS